MMRYYDLTIPFRCLLILGLFMELCVGGCLLPGIFRKKKASKIFAFLGMLLSGALMIIYTAEARARLRNLDVPEISDWLCGQPLLIPLLVFAVVAAYYVYLIKEERRFRKNTVTRSSIKEGIDKLSSGLCFYVDGGRVVLSNQRMNELCFRLLGRDLQNAALFWEILSSGQVRDDVECLASDDRPSFRLTDGTVWTFAYENLGGIHQLSAADTTQVHAVTEELREKNLELSALNLRLKEYSKNVEELTRTRERLETKVRVHSELGQALLATRKYLLDEDGTRAVPLDVWKRNIAMLHREAELKRAESPMEMLRRVAVAAGVALEIRGRMPVEERVETLFVQAGTEALTNAVRHAGAKTLYIRIDETYLL